MRRWHWFVVAGVVVAVLSVATSRWRKRGVPPKASARPLEEHGGRCATKTVAGGVVPCPYIGTKGDDLGAAFADETEGACRLAGQLVMPSGELVAADPLVFLNDRAFPVSVPPGTYPVFLAQPKRLSGDIAFALLRVRESRPVRWEIAKLPGEKPGAHFYQVDSGTGCYVDRMTARTILAREQAELDRQTAVVLQSGVDPNNAEAWHRAMDRARKERKDLLELLTDAGYGRDRSASLCVDAENGGNIVVFTSGAGDGSYGVHIGRDATGAVAAFVTDFALDSEP